ncbi:hypothetical protein GN958_ATG09090, partial [Phytophthora infestans]
MAAGWCDARYRHPDTHGSTTNATAVAGDNYQTCESMSTGNERTGQYEHAAPITTGLFLETIAKPDVAGQPYAKATQT